MTRRILTGNEAVALGALHAGVKVATGYPGTPSTGCLTQLLSMDLPGRHVEWSTNEKVAFEIAAGAAWAGQRALCTMKMSGVNVAYDALISIAYSGTNGGLVVYVADDPGVSAGMAEQDSRGFALMADLPMLEPDSPASAYELVQAAFELSEAVGTPVFLRATTAVALAHAILEVEGLETSVPPIRDVILERDIARYTKAGSKICLDQHRALIERLERAGTWIRDRGLHRLDLSSEPGGLGVVAAGAVGAYLDEALARVKLDSSKVSILRAVATNPFPAEAVRSLLGHCRDLLVLEELEPHFERRLIVEARDVGFGGAIVGKLDGTLSRIGEYDVGTIERGLAAVGRPQATDLTREASLTLLSHTAADLAAPRPVNVDQTGERPSTVLPSAKREAEERGAPTEPAPRPITVCAGAGRPQATDLTREASLTLLSHTAADLAAPRPITVCAGCPHRGTYMAIEAAIKKAGFKKDEIMVTGDIGCTILGMNPPFELLWNEVSMGTSVSLAQGYVHAGLETPVIATIGDSTFFHGGIPGLLNAVQHRTPLTLVVMDNGWTAMTGMQVNPGTDEGFQSGGRRIDLAAILPALGVDRFDVADPYDLEAMTALLVEDLKTPGVKVVLARRECAIQAARRKVPSRPIRFDPERCVLCKRCIQLTACPALGCLAIRESEPLGENRVSEGDSPGVPRRESAQAAAIVIDPALCNGCGLCAAVCPTAALSREAEDPAEGASKDGTKGDAR